MALASARAACYDDAMWVCRPLLLSSCFALLAGCDSDSASTTDTSLDASDAADTAAPSDRDASPEDAAPEVDADTADAEATTPDTEAGDGLHHVGYRTGSLTYRPADGSGERTLRLAFWYPTADTTGEEVRYLNFVPAPGVLGGAAPLGGPAPVVVFSHGNTAYAEQSAFFTEFLAARGFLVVAPDHTGNTFGQPLDPGIFHWRPTDLTAVIDHLGALPDTDPIAALVSDDIAVAGHSFGGYTVLAVGGARWAVDAMLAYCEADAIQLGGCDSLRDAEAIFRAGFLDPRVDAVISMSPGIVGVFGDSGLTHIDVPTLLVTGSRDQRTPNALEGDPAWAQLSGSDQNLRIDLATAGHFTFSDACSLPITIGADDGCGEGFIEPARAHAAVNAYALAFLRLHLAGDDSGAGLLSGAETVDPEVTLSIGVDR